MKNSINNNIAPAQIVGGMRVKHPDARRTSLRDESKEATSMNANDEEGREVDEEEQEEEQERMRMRAFQDRQAQDMQNHAASRQPDISKNAGNNVHKQYIAPAQPRSLNH
jgi:hypothetical protein